MLISGKELKAKENMNEKELVTDLLPKGVTIFAGKPKIGKSFLLLQLAISLCNVDSDFLNLQTDNDVRVIYFSNETNATEIKKRLESLAKPYDNILFEFSNSLKLEDIRKTIEEIRIQSDQNILVIIDTLQNVKYDFNYDNNSYQDMYKIINSYLQISSKYQVSFILVHHLNKQKDSDVINSINGSIAFSGASETVIILDKQNDCEYKLLVESRYINDKTLNLKRKNNGFFEIVEEENLFETQDQDIIKLMNFVAKQNEQFIEDTPTNICAKANLKNTTANWLLKKLKDNEKLLHQCNIFFEVTRTAEKRMIKIQYIENDEQLEENK